MKYEIEVREKTSGFGSFVCWSFLLMVFLSMILSK